MNTETKLYKGREYQDIIVHTTTSQFGFWDKLKILFGSKVVIHSEIYCNNERVKTVGSEAKTFIAPVFKRKQVKGLIQKNE